MNPFTTRICRSLLCLAFVPAVALAQMAQGMDEDPAAITGSPSTLAVQEQPASWSCLVQPYQISELGSASPGVIRNLQVHRGDVVRKGQVLVELNREVDEATLALRQSEAAYLNRVVERNKEVYNKKLLPEKDYDEMVSRLNQAQQQVKLQNVILAERNIRSPFDGVVAERYAGPGDRVNDNKILQLAQIDPLLVRVVVPATQYGKIAIDQAASVQVDAAISTEALDAKVWRIDKVMDAASGTFVVLLKLPNPKLAIPAGLRCSIRFQ